MNILILFSQPWRVGGAETHVEALIKGLEQEKVFLIVNVGSDEKKIDKLKDNHKNLQVIKMQFRGINIFSWINDFIKLKKQMLKLDEMHMYDLYVNPCEQGKNEITFEDAKQEVLNALQILGKEYINKLEEAFDNRWIDIEGEYQKNGWEVTYDSEQNNFVFKAIK